MANHPGKAPRAPMIGAKADLKPLGRVIGLLFRDYPAMLIITMICIIISAVVGILPAIYIETVTSYIEDGLTLGWDGVQGKILHALATMVGIYLAGVHGRLYAADGACDAGLPAQAAHADVRGDAEAAHPLL